MDPRIAERFGQNLRLHRRRAGLSQQELARLAELHRTEITLFELGRRTPRLDTFLKVSGGADAPPCDLLAGLHWQPGIDISLPGHFLIEDVPAMAPTHTRGIR